MSLKFVLLTFSCCPLGTYVCVFVQLGFPVINWQKVQLNTDLLKQRSRVFIGNAKVKFKKIELRQLQFWLKVRLIFKGSFNLQTVGEKPEPCIFRSFTKVLNKDVLFHGIFYVSNLYGWKLFRQLFEMKATEKPNQLIETQEF